MDRTAFRRDALIAGLLALVLGGVWTWSNRANLAALRLPDTDDLARLQQVRDWLAGQPFSDLTQYRLGTGVTMHWSRVADLGPAALIVALAPLIGRHGAEVAAVTLWPLLLFAVVLLLVARIARALGGAQLAATACAVAAMAYPATTLFLPGRIDHHGLQMVLLLAATLAMLARSSQGAGIAVGLLAAAGLAIGMETAPLLAVLGAVAIVRWIAGGDEEAARLQGLGIGALGGLAVARGLLATNGWDFPACDGFTGQAWRAAMILTCVPLALAWLGRWVIGARDRIASTSITIGLAGGAALAASPTCLRPYGAIDPLLARLWLSHVGEAQSVLAAPPATALSYAGLTIAGLAATLWQFRITRAPGWATLLALQLAALALTAVQLRGAYAGALLAAPALAAAIGAARARGAGFVAAAWAASAGMLYPLAADTLVPVHPTPAAAASGDCASPALLATLDRLPTGRVLAPVDAGAAILAGTRQRVVAAPYHRDGAGILASYRFYSGDARSAAANADRWQARYWLRCAAMPAAARVHGLIGWKLLERLPDNAAIFVRDGSAQ